MNENQIADIWLLVKEYVDKKSLESLAEHYVDLLADHGISDRVLKDSLGNDEVLDEAIEYYLGSEEVDEELEEDDWDYKEDEE